MNTTTNTTGTTGASHGTGLMGKIKNALDPNVSTTGGATTDVNSGYGNTATTGTGTTTGTHHHHAGRDGALAGAGVGAVQHERNTGGLGGTTGNTHAHHAGRDGALAGAGVGAVEHHRNHHNAGTTGTGTTGAGYDNTTTGGTGTYGSGTTGAGAGTGLGASTGTANVNPSNKHAGLTHTKGKLQEGLGNITGDRALQQKGLVNQEQANAERYQTGQISEAERLEQAAAARRGNAVQSGAHPGHGALGGTNY